MRTLWVEHAGCIYNVIEERTWHSKAPDILNFHDLCEIECISQENNKKALYKPLEIIKRSLKTTKFRPNH